jgi:hypothetical protein
MKKPLLILIAFITLIMNSCDTYSTYANATSNVWVEYELPPSKILKNGEVFFEKELSDGTKFSVYSAKEITDDASYYQTLLWQDFGWTLKNETTWESPAGSRLRKYGYIYVNPRRKVAVYFYPERTYDAFKVKFN